MVFAPIDYRYYVMIAGDRPEGRALQAFVWDTDRKLEGGGDAVTPEDRRWLKLWSARRDESGKSFDIRPAQTAPLILRVKSSVPCIAARVAYILAYTSGSMVATAPEGPYGSVESLLPELGADFDLVAALERFNDKNPSS